MVILRGGLGNQMFQYAFGRYLATLFETELFLENNRFLGDGYKREFNLDIFKLDAVRSGGIDSLSDVHYDSVYFLIEKKFEFDPEIIQQIKKIREKVSTDMEFLIVVSGYWQSPKYFEPISETLTHDFRVDIDMNAHILEAAEMIESTNSVMINVRRGDYLDKLDYHGVITVEYLTRSLNWMIENLDEPRFFCFSDDMIWCKENLPRGIDYYYMKESFYGYKFGTYFSLMKMCRSFVLSNSTFCWWAAWLSPFREKKVIVPKYWFAKGQELSPIDLIPREWKTF